MSTATAAPDGRRTRPWAHLLVGRVTPLGEVLAGGRVATKALQIAVAVFLSVVLWRALYVGTSSQAGLDREQAVTYAVLGTVLVSTRFSASWLNGDTVLQRMQQGTILFWFLRPMSARRYYFVRGLGELGYAQVWLAVTVLVCLPLGVIQEPDPAMLPVFVVSLLLGNAIFYELNLVLDLLCFWTVMNQSAVQIMFFVQTLLSGGFAPLWFFPDWFRTVSLLLPFQGTLNVPVSIYVGRLPASQIAGSLALQIGWVVGLWLFNRWLWERASRRVTVQGG
jgi:ABC-2 type transport system permease protein